MAVGAASASPDGPEEPEPAAAGSTEEDEPVEAGLLSPCQARQESESSEDESSEESSEVSDIVVEPVRHAQLPVKQRDPTAPRPVVPDSDDEEDSLRYVRP